MEELDLKRLLTIFWSKKLEITLIIILLILTGAVYSYMILEPKYNASTTLLLATTNKEGTGITQTDVALNSNLVSTYSELIKSKAVVREVIHNLQIEDLTEEYIRNNIIVSSVRDTELIEIVVKHTNQQIAVKIADEIAKVFSEKIVEIYNISNVYIVDKAEEEKVPSNINHKKDLIVFTFIGIVIASAYVIMDGLLDNTIKNEEDVEKATDLFVLATIPKWSNNLKEGGRKR